MYSKILLNIILIIILTVIQISFINNLGQYLNNLNLVLVILIFILGMGGLKLTLWWAIGLGFMFDIFSFSAFGIYLICFNLSLILTYILLINFFTDRSLYSFLALTFFITLFYNSLFYLSNYLIWQFKGQNIVSFLGKSIWLGLLSELVLNFLSVIIIFYFLNFISHRLKPVFLLRR